MSRRSSRAPSTAACFGRAARFEQVDQMRHVHRRGAQPIVEVVHEVLPLLLLPRLGQLPLGEPQRFFGLEAGSGALPDGKDLSLVDQQDHTESGTDDPEDRAEEHEHLRKLTVEHGVRAGARHHEDRAEHHHGRVGEHHAPREP
jgi:hypothetical protein